MKVLNFFDTRTLNWLKLHSNSPLGLSQGLISLRYPFIRPLYFHKVHLYVPIEPKRFTMVHLLCSFGSNPLTHLNLLGLHISTYFIHLGPNKFPLLGPIRSDSSTYLDLLIRSEKVHLFGPYVGPKCSLIWICQVSKKVHLIGSFRSKKSNYVDILDL